MKLFKDRKAAGKILAERLKDAKADLVLGIPRGGVVVAAEIANQLSLPLDILVTRKIGAPDQPELALGAIDPDGEAVWDKDLIQQLKIENLKLEIQESWKELKRREDIYRQDKKPMDVNRKKVILVDDGMATGATVQAAVRYLERHGAYILLAIPVASKDALVKIREIEGIREIILETPENFRAVGQFYKEFEPVSDEDVVKLLEL